MKILVITNYYPPHLFGGCELACKTTVDYLAKKGHTVYVLAGDYMAQRPEHELKGPPPYRMLKYIDYEKPSYHNKYLVEKYNYQVTKELIHCIKPNLVYFWSIKGISIAPVMAVQDAGVKRLFEIGDFWPGTYLQPGFSAQLKRRLKALIPFTVGGRMEISPVVAVSKWVGDEMKEKYGSRDVFVVPNGINVPEFVTPRDNSDGIVRYMFSGRLDPEKGLDLAERILLVHNDPQLRKNLAEAAREKVMDKYDVKIVKKQVEQILMSQVEER